MHICLGEEIAVCEVDVLDAFGGDVLALSEFEDVLSTIDDFEAAHAIDFSDVAGVEPAVCVDCFGGFGFVAVVFAETGGTSEEDFTSGVGCVGGEVFHVGDGFEAHFHCGEGKKVN